MYVIQWVGLEGEFNMLSILTDYAGDLNDLLGKGVFFKTGELKQSRYFLKN